MVTAMMQRDQELKAQMAAAAYQPPAQPAPQADTFASAPAQPEMPVEQPTCHGGLFLRHARAVWHVGASGRLWSLLEPLVVVSQPGWQPYCDCGHWVYTDAGCIGCRIIRGAGRRFITDAGFIMTRFGWVLDAGHNLGAVVGDVALRGRLLRLGAAAAGSRFIAKVSDFSTTERQSAPASTSGWA